MSIELNIQPESGIPVAKAKVKQKRRARSPGIQGHIDKFAAFKIGQSFFVAGVRSIDLNFLRKPLVEEGIGVLMREVKCDEIYQVAGVRVWRQHGPYDEARALTSATQLDPSTAAPTSATQLDPSTAAPTSDYDPDLDSPANGEDDEL